MHADLWTFSLNSYAKPGVEQSCLALQAQGVNVCLLLCAAWLGQRGVRCESGRVRQLQALAEPWHEQVVQPLQHLRMQWRTAASEDIALKVLRDQLKALELAAEQQLMQRLEALGREWSEVDANDLDAWLEAVAHPAALFDSDALRQLRVAVSHA